MPEADAVETPNNHYEPMPRVIDKHTKHRIAAVLLGTVTGAYMLGNSMVLYYADGHKCAISVDEEDGELLIGDYHVPSC